MEGQNENIDNKLPIDEIRKLIEEITYETLKTNEEATSDQIKETIKNLVLERGKELLKGINLSDESELRFINKLINLLVNKSIKEIHRKDSALFLNKQKIERELLSIGPAYTQKIEIGNLNEKEIFELIHKQIQSFKFIEVLYDEVNLKMQYGGYLEQYRSKVALEILIDKQNLILKIFSNNPNKITEFESELEKIIKNQLEQYIQIYEKDILQYLLVMGKYNGISYFNYSFKGFEFEPIQLSGLLSAIQTFGYDLMGLKTPIKTLQYQDFNILLYYGEDIISALITIGQSLSLAQKLEKFSIEFEKKFDRELKEFKGRIDKFKPAKELIPNFF